MEKIDKVTKIEIIITDEGAQMFFNGNKEKSCDAQHEIECNI